MAVFSGRCILYLQMRTRLGKKEKLKPDTSPADWKQILRQFHSQLPPPLSGKINVTRHSTTRHQEHIILSSILFPLRRKTCHLRLAASSCLCEFANGDSPFTLSTVPRCVSRPVTRLKGADVHSPLQLQIPLVHQAFQRDIPRC